jgi:hypothetical protein
MPARTLPNFEDDPLTNAIKPPADETPEERQRRLRSEQDAKTVSDSIDEELESQRAAERNGQKPVKILLLGESPLHFEQRAPLIGTQVKANQVGCYHAVLPHGI